MKSSVLRYVTTALIALVVGFAFLLGQYWYYAPTPEPKITYALYQFAWGDHAVTARTNVCFERNGTFIFYAIDSPVGWAHFSMHNLKFALCLEEPVPEMPLSF